MLNRALNSVMHASILLHLRNLHAWQSIESVVSDLPKFRKPLREEIIGSSSGTGIASSHISLPNKDNIEEYIR